MPRNERDENLVIAASGDIALDTSHTAANGSATVTISNVAPSAVGTATISRWLQMDIGGTAYFIPMWT